MTPLVVCRFAHFMAAMLTFGASAYLWLYAPERLTRALSPAVRRLALIASLVALLTAILWLALESAAMADDWSGAVDLDMIDGVLTDTAFGHAWARPSYPGGGARRRRRLRPARPMGGDGHRVSGSAREPWPCRPRRDADRRRRRSASREPRRPSPDGRGVDRRPHSLRDVPQRLSGRRFARRGGARDDRLFLLGTIRRRGDRPHRRRQHRVDLRAPADPADHALPRASRRENRSRRGHDRARGL